MPIVGRGSPCLNPLPTWLWSPSAHRELRVESAFLGKPSRPSPFPAVTVLGDALLLEKLPSPPLRTVVLLAPLVASDPLGPLYWLPTVSHTFCPHCSSALLCSQRFGISLPPPASQPPQGSSASRTLHLASAGSAFLPSSWWQPAPQGLAACPSAPQPAPPGCAVTCPPTVTLLHIYLLARCLSPHLSVHSTKAGTLSVSLSAWNSNCGYLWNERNNPMRIPIVVSISLAFSRNKA